MGDVEINSLDGNKIDLKSINIEHGKLAGRGGAFLVNPIDKGSVFSREQFSEEHKMFEQTAREFGINRILPVREDLNVLNKDLSLEIFKEMGQLGFLGVDVPEEHGGLALDKTTACIIVEALSSGQNASIMVTASAHTGIAMLPIVWYGNEEQKKKYLPKLSSGEWMGCYSLTEPGAGSDALSGSATATLNDEGTHYLLNGQKIYVTNGGWADVAVTFASVDGKYTAFILDRNCDGWVIGEEEKKMGIKGSSTVTFFYENCKVPLENVLGKVGEGGPIAFNVLYVGRYKLGVTTAAGAKYVIDGALNFANERQQFNRPIKEFGMLQRKFANMVVRCWEADSINYMVTGSIDAALLNADKNANDYYDIVQKVIEDHGIEASISKVVGSETLAFSVDEGVQVMGGAGFIEEYPMAAMYRDERINRIFEGTNEINRLIIGGTTLKKAILEEIPLRDMILHRREDWLPSIDLSNHDYLSDEAKAVEYCRSFTLFCLHESILKHGQDLKNEQWIIEPFANMVISLSLIDTGFKRFIQLDNGDHKDNTLDVLRLSIMNNFESCHLNGMKIINYLHEGETLGRKNKLINDWHSKVEIKLDEIQCQKRIVDVLYKMNKYYLN
ncbi:MAG: acyl-CoA dehydrogenase family protein [Candidatus Neomarinimicrobiota bacterium]|nr:acyl-CoA dehydrogenase family protein [Candidatus Neomarinimicrobiota bacterium]